MEANFSNEGLEPPIAQTHTGAQKPAGVQSVVKNEVPEASRSTAGDIFDAPHDKKIEVEVRKVMDYILVTLDLSLNPSVSYSAEKNSRESSFFPATTSLREAMGLKKTDPVRWKKMLDRAAVEAREAGMNKISEVAHSTGTQKSAEAERVEMNEVPENNLAIATDIQGVNDGSSRNEDAQSVVDEARKMVDQVLTTLNSSSSSPVVPITKASENSLTSNPETLREAMGLAKPQNRKRVRKPKSDAEEVRNVMEYILNTLDPSSKPPPKPRKPRKPKVAKEDTPKQETLADQEVFPPFVSKSYEEIMAEGWDLGKFVLGLNVNFFSHEGMIKGIERSKLKTRLEDFHQHIERIYPGPGPNPTTSESNQLSVIPGPVAPEPTPTTLKPVLTYNEKEAWNIPYDPIIDAQLRMVADRQMRDSIRFQRPAPFPIEPERPYQNHMVTPLKRPAAPYQPAQMQWKMARLQSMDQFGVEIPVKPGTTSNTVAPWGYQQNGQFSGVAPNF